MTDDATYIDPTAFVDPAATVGEGTKIWNWTKVRERARIGHHCIIGQGVYIDHAVVLGDRCKVQNLAQLYQGVVFGESVFVGPNAIFPNDMYPRAHNHHWEALETVAEDGASIGAGAIVLCGVRLGTYCMVGAGAVVTHDVPPFGLVVGQPAQLIDYVNIDGRPLHHDISRPPPADLLRAARP